MAKPSMSDIAKLAGVSKNAVSLALRNDAQISEKTREKIAAIAEKLGYAKNPVVSHLMTQLRQSRSPRFQASLGLINAHSDPKAFAQHPTIPTYVAGCRRRAAQLGYVLDEFWLHDPDLDGTRLNRILQARGIRGLVITGLMKENRLPKRFASTWEAFPCVVTGVRTRQPALSFAATDHHMLTMRAFEKALELGYQRPALVLDREIDLLIDGRFSAGIYTAQLALPEKQRLKPFYEVNRARNDPDIFWKWFDREKPDAILTLYNVVRHWLEKRGLQIGMEVGLIQMEWRADRPDWAGMNQHNDIVGEAAVEMLVGMLHNGEKGVPVFPRATLVGSSWMDGATALRS
ncbi:MAG: LacI family DNA-binding transcriptional regulator [Chthoniobacterales bacterium]